VQLLTREPLRRKVCASRDDAKPGRVTPNQHPDTDGKFSDPAPGAAIFKQMTMLDAAQTSRG
jgi:hypothetical protein